MEEPYISRVRYMPKSRSSFCSASHQESLWRSNSCKGFQWPLGWSQPLSERPRRSAPSQRHRLPLPHGHLMLQLRGAPGRLQNIPQTRVLACPLLSGWNYIFHTSAGFYFPFKIWHFRLQPSRVTPSTWTDMLGWTRSVSALGKRAVFHVFFVSLELGT